MRRPGKSRSKGSSYGQVAGMVVALFGALCIWALGEVAGAHEHEHTHQNLARASFRLLNAPLFKSGALGGLTEQQIEDEIAQGVIDEDVCVEFDDTDSGRDWEGATNWNSHFYEAKQAKKLGVNMLLGNPFDGCEFVRFGEHTNAAVRAGRLYDMAKDDYRAGRYRSSFRILGRVLHLLEDMTSPAHVHDDPHAEPFRTTCGQDSDDFERWGYCAGLAADGLNTRICEYFHDPLHTNRPGQPTIQFWNCTLPPETECRADFDSNGVVESYGVPPRGFSCRMWAALKILYGGTPQGNKGSSDALGFLVGENAGAGFVRHVANITYDFTTFTVHLQDVSGSEDPQPDSELKLMLRGSTQSECRAPAGFEVGLCEGTDADAWRIGGEFQNIGRSYAMPGSIDSAWPDTSEEWWIMPTFYNKRIDGILFPDVFIDGYVYIENAGGEGPNGFGDQDSFIPRRYGCTAAENRATGGWLCSEHGVGRRSKAMYQRLYGTVRNNEDPFPETRVANHGKTMLRIYGDVLYPTAVAYGAGLIKSFIDEVSGSPVAMAGGPYEGEACTPVNFDAGDSSDENGTVASYAWDFNDDGTFDATTPAPQYSYAYPAGFNGLARLRVTDNQGLTDEATATVVVTSDVMAPVISKIRATPDRLWPANDEMRSVHVGVFVSDGCGNSTCRIVGVSSNDPEESAGSNRSEPDWIVVDPLTVKLRAQRSGDVWQRVYTIELSCVDAAGNATTGTVNVTVPHDQKPPSRKVDFNLNGWVDLLWHHQTNGQIATWLMTGLFRDSATLFEVRPQDSDWNWKVVGSGDIDQDGFPDLVWQNASNGTLRYWSTDNVRVISEHPLTPNIVRDTNWKIRAVGDFSQDGKPDFVWQHETDGRLAMWFMDGATLVSGVPFGPGQVMDLGWKIVGCGDFDGDGWPDLAWQHQGDGRIAVWRMRGTVVLSAELISPSQVFDLNWKIRGAGDINGDGMPDLLWQHRTRGEVGTWLMNKTTMMAGISLGFVPDTNWHIVGPR